MYYYVAVILKKLKAAVIKNLTLFHDFATDLCRSNSMVMSSDNIDFATDLCRSNSMAMSSDNIVSLVHVPATRQRSNHYTKLIIAFEYCCCDIIKDHLYYYLTKI